MRGEPEVGSVIEKRIDAFAQADQRIALGHEERRCLRCDSDWGTANLCPKCGYNECSVKEVRPTPVVLQGWGTDARPIIGTLAEKVKTKVSVTETELDSLRGLRLAIVVLEEHLQAADSHLHRLVNRSDENWDIFGFLQQAVHGLWDGNIGDFSLRSTSQVSALSLAGPLKALREEIDVVLRRHEEAKK